MTAITDCTRTRSRWARCRALATLSVDELLGSTPIPEDARLDDGRLGCELVAGHQGRHITLIATAQGDDEWWWLRWDGPADEVEVLQIDPCDAELPQGPYADDCLSPKGHPGPHSYDLPPHPSMPGRRHAVLGRPRTP